MKVEKLAKGSMSEVNADKGPALTPACTLIPGHAVYN